MKNKIFNISIIAFISIIAILTINYLNTPKEGSLIKLTYDTVTQKIENKDTFILVVSQSTCSHCATYKPKLKKITQKYGIDVYYIDYDEESESTQTEFLKEFNLSGSTPTTLFIENGKEKSLLNRIEGDLSESTIITQFQKMNFLEE